MTHENGSPTTAEISATNGSGASRRSAGADLRASELRYRRLFETAQDGIFLLDAPSGRITDVNPFLEQLLGYTHAELVGKELWQIGPVEDVEASREAMRHLQNEEYIRYENLPLETKSKERVHVEFVSNLYLVGEERVIQCNVRNITARRVAEENAARLNGELLALVADMERRDREMIRLNHMNDLLHACATQDEAFAVIAQAAGDLFPGHSGFLAMLQPGDRRLESVSRWGDDALGVAGFVLADCWAMRRGRPHEVLDPHGDLVCRHFTDQPKTGYLCVPLTVRGETLGLLCIVGAPRDPSRTRPNLHLAVSMGEAVKLSISNLRLREELREQATIDALTGLHNRRYMDESLARELHRAVRRKSPLCVALLDLDHFKRFNDEFGHEAGDALLREIGHVLRVNVRKSDISCRYGGEEFVLVFPDSAMAGARQRVEQIRNVVKSLDLRYGGRSFGSVTLSAGIAEADAAGSTPSEVLRAADAALYLAKQRGRDCVVEHVPPG